jgi:beta-N-acetylhexosaminidase
VVAPTDPALARLVDATLMPSFAGSALPDWLARRVERGIGGVCLFNHNVTQDVAQLTASLHALRPGVVVASDEEGGEVTRLEAATGSSWPGHAALGRFDDLGTTRRVAHAIGRQSRAAGIDLVLAPVVDVGSEPDNPVIGLRGFGSDTGLVSRHASAFVEGLQSAGVAACAKHFPGHGGTRTDSHVGLPVLDIDAATLRHRDLPPFAAAVAAGVRAVMTAHVTVPAVDDVPATLSAVVLRMLREELGFAGLVVTDALDMRAISAGVGRGRGAVLALRAGVDLVAIGNPRYPRRYDAEQALEQVRAAVLDAVRSGELPAKRLEDAAGRVAGLARWVAAAAEASGAASDASGQERADRADRADRALALRVAREVVDCGGTPTVRAPLHVIDLRGAPNPAAGRRPSGIVVALSARLAVTTVREVAAGPQPASALVSALAEATGATLLVLVGAPHRHPSQQRLLEAVLDARPDAVVASTGLPDARERLGQHWVHTWGDGRSTGEAVADLLLGPGSTGCDRSG